MAERSSLVRLHGEFQIDIDWRGFELHPETPVGGRPFAERIPADERPALLEYLRQFAASFGVTNMQIPSHTPNTRRVLALAEYAREQGKLEAFRECAMDAYWQTGANLEDPPVLQALACQAGLAPDAALQALDDVTYLKRIDAIRHEAGAKGVTGIPTFIIGQQQVVGCQPYETLAQAAERAGVQRRTDGADR